MYNYDYNSSDSIECSLLQWLRTITAADRVSDALFFM